MAVHMKSIPTLRGQVGSRFIAMSEEITAGAALLTSLKKRLILGQYLKKNLIKTKHYVRDRI